VKFADIGKTSHT